jgi:hypothetical protein
VAAALVWSQLDLFETRGALALKPHILCRWKMSDCERDRRTGGQWLRAVKAYLEFGSGSAWRRLSDPEQRNSPVRDWYLGGIRTMNGIPSRGALAPSGVSARRGEPAAAASVQTPIARLTAARSRGWIVEELLRVNPALTDKKLLLRLSHLKLAEMLVTARRGASAAARPAGKKESRRMLPKQPKSVVPAQDFPAPLRGAA